MTGAPPMPQANGGKMSYHPSKITQIMKNLRLFGLNPQQWQVVSTHPLLASIVFANKKDSQFRLEARLKPLKDFEIQSLQVQSI